MTCVHKYRSCRERTMNKSTWLFCGVFLILTALVLVTTSELAYAEVTALYASNTNNTIFIAYEGDLSEIKYTTSQGTSEHYDSIVKEFSHGGFFLKSPEIVVFGHPQGNDEYILVVMTSMGFEKFTATAIDLNPLEEDVEEFESILEEYWANRDDTVIRESEKEREIIIPEPEKIEIIIVPQMPNTVPWMSNYGIDLRVFDKSMNSRLDYYWNDGRISEATITGKFIDPSGNILKSFDGITSKFGHYFDYLYIPANANTNLPFTIDILASKYFDGELATFSLVKQFTVYSPFIGSSGGQSCPGNELMAPNGTCVPECPAGTTLDTSDWICKEN